MTTLRLAVVGGAQGDLNNLRSDGAWAMTDVRLVAGVEPEKAILSAMGQERAHLPALLVSYYYLDGFLKHQSRYRYRDWVLDSGAFSAFNSGKEINLQAYIDTCKRLRDSDATLAEIYALDVIGDWRASLRNTEEMWKQGVEAIPCYHCGEPESVLRGIAADYPKIALGGTAHIRGSKKKRWFQQCFARIWPKAVHGFAVNAEDLVMAVPWHSVDASSWELGPCAFGRWKAYGNMSVRGSLQDLTQEINWYLDMEKRARAKWRKQMQELKSSYTQRLALSNGQAERNGSLEGPTVRLAEVSTQRPKFSK